MAYDAALDARIAKSVSKWYAERRKMFGGTCYLLRGNLFCGVHGNRLILRLGKEAAAEALKKPFVSEFDITGRPMKGWVMVEKDGETVNGKSIMGLMMLAAGPGSRLTVHCDGQDASEAAHQIEQLINNKFNEE
jgi:hypothetical protein